MILKDKLIRKYYLNKYLRVSVPHSKEPDKYFHHYGTLIDFSEDAFFLLNEKNLQTIRREDIREIEVKP